ncbi:hypothetical protein RB195_021522 [Necator americanus]|uniref:Uncharacterized protein n=1 Tax=Necator americanus TaxID=51031 RepID=A0ABR1EBG5_NECAM
MWGRSECVGEQEQRTTGEVLGPSNDRTQLNVDDDKTIDQYWLWHAKEQHGPCVGGGRLWCRCGAVAVMSTFVSSSSMDVVEAARARQRCAAEQRPHY